MSENTETGLDIGDEFDGVDFGDLRLNRRLLKIATELGGCPTGSIPAATLGRAEMEAAYRFFDNSNVTPADVLAPHREATLHRIRQCKMVVLAQDTTEMDLTRPAQQVEGAGPLTSDSRRGSYYHPLMAFNLDNLCLGTVWNKHWVREKIHAGRSEADKQRAKLSTPIEDKESMRWIEGIRAGREVAQACPQTRCVCVSDSESDIYELFAEPRMSESGNELQLVIRACRDRKLLGSDDKILDAVRSSACLYKCTVDVSSRKAKRNAQRSSPRTSSRDARTAEVEVRAVKVTLAPPSRPDRKLPALELNVVLVEEPNPPEGQDPIQWLLVTTLPIATPDQVQLIVQCYCIRWQIEIYFRTLKSGCKVEERLFERFSRFENCLAVYIVVAWKVLYLCQLGRNCPEMDCEVVFTPSEWKAVYMVVNRTDPPSTPPKLNEMIRLIASLGGYVIRKNSQPGPQTLWLGLQRVNDLSHAWDAFGPDSREQAQKKLLETCVVQ